MQAVDSIGVIITLYIAGLILLGLELFIPSHGLLTILALVCLGFAVVGTYARDMTTGLVATGICVVTIPTVLLLGIKYVHRLPMGKHLAPPNPMPAEARPAFDSSDYVIFVGKTGRAVTALRPVGVCEFGGRRVQCVAESGIIDPDTTVVGTEMRLHNLVVRPAPPTAT
jgi:membrane-bound ClpP family serine protease